MIKEQKNNRKIRTVNKCEKYTRFYVYSNSVMSLIKDYNDNLKLF